MWSDPLNGLPIFYGLGWIVTYDKEGRLLLWHGGIFTTGAATIVRLVPSEHLGIVVLTNASPLGVGEGLSLTFTDLALYGKATQDWLTYFKKMYAAAALGVGTDYSKPPAAPRPGWRLARTSGPTPTISMERFRSSNRATDSQLLRGPAKLTFPLKHYDRDLFTCENTEGETGGVTFTIGADGKATTVVVEELNLQGEGTFKR
jgi:hypothetical protein